MTPDALARLIAQMRQSLGTPDDYSDDGEPIYFLRVSKIRGWADELEALAAAPADPLTPQEKD